MNSLRISSCVLTYNGKDRVIPTLESLKLQTYPYKDLVIADEVHVPRHGGLQWRIEDGALGLE